MLNQIETIIESLKELCAIESVPLDQVSELSFGFRGIDEYIESLKSKSKPESAAGELLSQILKLTIESQISSEVNYQGDFVDYVIDEGAGNPLLIELKPFFRLNPKKTALIQAPFKYEKHREQIQKYLRHKNVEYVILTNIHQAFLFNREAMVDFVPFRQTTLPDILEQYLTHGNLWDTIRRLEDQEIRPDLDTEFFDSLKKWFNQCANLSFKPNLPFSKEELIVLFLNKFIFIKTLEDYGLIEYNFIQEIYKNHVLKWKPKGFHMVLKNFFREIEEFFQIYYDTELFKSNFWEFIEPTKKNIQEFKDVFELILGLDKWSVTFGKGLVHYNYRHINEDIFGKAYETWIAENRKDEGIYYTPASITEYMAQKITDALFDGHLAQLKDELKNGNPDADRIERLMMLIQKIRIIDPASGSGSFLIKVLKVIYEKYQDIAKETQWAFEIRQDLIGIPENIRLVQDFRKKYLFEPGYELEQISAIILHHIFAADKDERSLDTAKTNLWKEAVKLNPRIYNYRRLDSEKIHILPNLEQNFICGDSLADMNFEQQIRIISDEFRAEIVKLYQIRNQYLENPFHPEIIEAGLEIKKKIRARLSGEIPQMKNPLFFCLEYFYCFFDEQGEPLEVSDRGFSGVISNPPWEAIKPVKKEFAKLRKNEMDILHFNKWFSTELKQNEEFKAEWQAYGKFYKDYTAFLYGKYKYQSTGDPNFYKFFMERDFQIIQQNGYYALLVPSGFQTDRGSNILRKLLIETYSLIELSSFENRGYEDESQKYKIKLFPDVDNRFKFSIVLAQKIKSRERYSFDARFYLHDPKSLKDDDFIKYDIDKIKKFSPVNQSIMEFRSPKDYELCTVIRKDHKLLTELDIQFRTEFHMTNDSRLFDKFKSAKGICPLYEGKMIHQFHSAFSEPRYGIHEEKARENLLRKVCYRIKKEYRLSDEEWDEIKIPDDLLLDYQTYRLVYRAVGRSTDERTLICSVVPPSVFVGHSMNYVVNVAYKSENNGIESIIINSCELLFLMSLFNSLVLNYYIRNKISANLTMNFIYELPIAEANDQDKQRSIELAFNLLYLKNNQEDFEDLKNDLKIEIDNTRDIAEMRAELEVIIAKHLYQLDKSDWEYLTSTFTYGGATDTKAELDKIIAFSKEMWEDL